MSEKKVNLDTPAGEYDARVVSVYDGDTVMVEFKGLCGCAECATVYVARVRLDGIDTPELKSKDTQEHEAAVRARDRLRELTLEKACRLCVSATREKFGRLLCVLTTPDGKDVAEVLCEEGLARRYDGGTKAPWVFPTRPV